MRTVLVGAAGCVCAAGLFVAAAQGDGAILRKSGAIQVNDAGTLIFAVNPDHDSISRVQVGAEFYNVTHIPLPSADGRRQHPMGVALQPGTGFTWVAARDSDRVYIFETLQSVFVATIDLPLGSAPIAVAITPDGSRALVALHSAAAVAVIDTSTRQVTAIISGLFRAPRAIAFTSNPDEAWIAHDQADGEDSYVSVINTATNAVKALIPLKFVNPRTRGQVQGDPDPVPEGGYVMLRGHIAQPPGISDIWLPTQYNNRQNEALASHSTINAALHKISLSTYEHYIDNRVVLSAVYAHTNSNVLVGDGWNARIAGPIDIAFSADGATAYMLNADSNDVVVFPTDIGLARPDGAPPLVEIPLGDHPIGIAASPTSNRLFVVNYLSRNLSVISTDSLTEVARIPLTSGPDPVPADARLGARIFNASDDPRISASGKISCASCHPNGDSDSHSWEFAQFGAGTRKSLSLLGIALSAGPPVNGRGQFHRSGDRDELADFDLTFRLPIMGGTGFIPAINPALGPPNAGLSPEADALAAFMLSLPAIEHSPHRLPSGALSESAIRGGAIFAATSGPLAPNCNACHTAPTFTDRDFHAVGGFTTVPEHEGPLFNTPSLVGAWRNGPYRQGSGSASDNQTLGSVLRAARAGNHGNTAPLSRTQLRDLENFLLSIDGRMAQEGIDDIADTLPPRVTALKPLGLSKVQVFFNETVDQTTATNPDNYRLTDGIRVYAPTAVAFDDQRGNVVTLDAPLRYHGCEVTYTLLPGPIEDVAGLVTGGANNALDPNDPANQRSFTLDGSITVTFGDTGDENFPSVCQDAGFEPTLASVSRAYWRLYPATNLPTKGLVRFDFVPTLQTVCGVESAADVLDARFSALPRLGFANALEFRRCLKPWNEPPTDQCFACPGSVTRNSAMHGSLLWSMTGARAVGNSGALPSHYYPATTNADIASVIDAAVTLPGLNQRADFAAPGILDAFRFWFDNPQVNYGYVVNAVQQNLLGTEFCANEQEGGARGFSLAITFAIHPQPVADDCNANGIDDDCDFRAGVLHDKDMDGIYDECRPCRPDWNADRILNSQDFFDFILDFFGKGADYNQDGITNSQDFFDFLADFFAGCE